ncbi:hypothetical protein [Lignipirellula cremea]|uniref:hypothetical protein n=1 Tax=Lignipirellula cremea TaxID=2528010 RepID=UPI0011A09DB3|nr:hypothetical protein [Lignipirellula cremea]
MGSFHFGYVHGHIGYRIPVRGDEPAVDFSWDGNNEMDPAMGRGWAIVKDGRLEGVLYFHGGDESGFVAARE